MYWTTQLARKFCNSTASGPVQPQGKMHASRPTLKSHQIPTAFASTTQTSTLLSSIGMRIIFLLFAALERLSDTISISKHVLPAQGCCNISEPRCLGGGFGARHGLPQWTWWQLLARYRAHCECSCTWSKNHCTGKLCSVIVFPH